MFDHYTKDSFNNLIFFNLKELACAKDSDDVAVNAEYSDQQKINAGTLRSIIMFYGIQVGGRY